MIQKSQEPVDMENLSISSANNKNTSSYPNSLPLKKGEKMFFLYLGLRFLVGKNTQKTMAWPENPPWNAHGFPIGEGHFPAGLCLFTGV